MKALIHEKPGRATREALSLLKTMFLVMAMLVPFASCYAQVQSAQHHNWKVYTNVRFQYSICYPEDLLVPQGEAENSDGETFLAKDGAKLIVFGRHNATNQTIKDTLEDTSTRLAGDSGKVTYKVVKPNWFVVSGENGQRVFYAKMLLANEQFKSFELTYDNDASSTYRPLMSRLASCFASTAH